MVRRKEKWALCHKSETEAKKKHRRSLFFQLVTLKGFKCLLCSAAASLHVCLPDRLSSTVLCVLSSSLRKNGRDKNGRPPKDEDGARGLFSRQRAGKEEWLRRCVGESLHLTSRHTWCCTLPYLMLMALQSHASGVLTTSVPSKTSCTRSRWHHDVCFRSSVPHSQWMSTRRETTRHKNKYSYRQADSSVLNCCGETCGVRVSCARGRCLAVGRVGMLPRHV